MYTEFELNNLLARLEPPTIADAVRSLTTDAAWRAEGTTVTFISGSNLPTQAEINAEFASLTDQWNAALYIRQRAVAFAEKSAGEQFDTIYWDQVNSTTLWRDWVAGIKAAYPKPAQ